MKIIAVAVLIICLTLSFVPGAGAQGKKEEPKTQTVTAPATPAVAAMPASAATGAATPPTAARRPNFVIVFGAITKIDTSDQAKTKLEVKSDMDGASHIVEITPWTNVTKVTDVGELKAGDTVRIMARKVDNSEVAMTVVFGKIRNIYAPRATTPAAPPAAPTQGAAQGAAKK